jgi:hypothetical protein
MKDHYDPWYVRLPDGRTIKAKSTTSVRHHVEAGHIPLNSLLRRTSDDEWVELTWIAEFVDLGPNSPSRIQSAQQSAQEATARSGLSARLDPMRLQTVGVRGLIDELIAALDSTLTKTKIVPALFAGVLLYMALFGAQVIADKFFVPGHQIETVGVAAAFIILVLTNTLIGRLTHLELSTMRPAKLSNGFSTGVTLQVLIAQTVVAGGGLALLFAMNKIHAWAVGESLSNVHFGGGTWFELSTLIFVLVMLLSIPVWLVIGLCWLLTPAIVVEESSWIGGLREWRQLLREHFGRILVYEGLALFLGFVVSVPLTMAVSLALYGQPTFFPSWPASPHFADNWGLGLIEAGLKGLTAGPLIATLAVTNVFIYLNLRYEYTPAK